MLKISYFHIIVLLLLLSGCLDEPSQPELVVPIAPESADAMTYIHAQNNFSAVDGKPLLVDFFTLYVQYKSWHIIDVRTAEKFNSGHIEYAVNIIPNNLLVYLRDLELEENVKIALVCSDGQLSSYLQCFARIAGFNNVFTLHFGMASWNSDFSHSWKANSLSGQAPMYYYLDNFHNAAPDNYIVPSIDLIDANSIPEKMYERIDRVLNNNNFTSQNIDDESSLFISIEDVYSKYDAESNSFSNLSIYCYDLLELYQLYGNNSPTSSPSHPPTALHIDPPLQFDYRLDNGIQKVPSGEIVIIYSSDGHASAFVTAILRVLGYNAKSMLYGANTFGGAIMPYTKDEVRNGLYRIKRFFNLPYIQ